LIAAAGQRTVVSMDEAAAQRAPGFVRTVLDVSLHPRRTFAKPVSERTSWHPLLFALTLSVVAAVLGAIWTIIPLPFATPHRSSAAIGIVIGQIILAIPGLYVQAGILHGLLWALGSRGRRFADTLDCSCLALAPEVLCVIPWVGGSIAFVWSWVILVVALREVHGRGWARSLAAVVVPVFGPVVLALGLRAFLLEAFQIPSAGMWPTFQVGDHIFVMKGRYRPDYGDAIVFKNPADRRSDFVKRAIGMPGDRVKIEKNRLIINDWPVPRCPVGAVTFGEAEGVAPPSAGQLSVEFLGDRAYLVFEQDDRADDSFGSYRVPEREVFVLGDNRHNSADSRSWNQGSGGGVPIRDVKGGVWIVWLSFGRDGRMVAERIGHSLLGPPRLPTGVPGELRESLARCLGTRPRETRPPLASAAGAPL
jgi:signal peptidase I